MKSLVMTRRAYFGRSWRLVIKPNDKTESHMSHIVLVTRLAVAVVFSFGVSTAFAQELRDPSRAVQWSGVVAAGAGPTADVPECAPGCQRFDLSVNLPYGVWLNKPGGVEVALRWGGRTLADNVKLYVYRAGALLAKSDGIISTAQSVRIDNAENGTYNVYAVFDPVDALSTEIAYDGLAEVEHDPEPHPSRTLQPDLTVRPQRNLGFDPGGIFFDAISADHPTCYESEVTEDGATLCLRFDQIFANIGEGALQLRFSLPAGEYPPTTLATQRLFTSDGGFTDRVAGEMEFHETHGHYHFRSFGVSSLWAVDGSGNIGATPVRRHVSQRPIGATLTATGRKVSFCLADIHVDRWAEKGNGVRTYNAPECLFPAFSEGGTDHYVQGITNGWADVYDWYLPDQYIDVAGLADGTYLLQTVADPDGLLIEADKSNNCGAVLIRLEHLNTPSPSATLLGPAGSCAGAR